MMQTDVLRSKNWVKLRNEEFLVLYSSRSIFRIKDRGDKTGGAEGTHETGCVRTVLVKAL